VHVPPHHPVTRRAAVPHPDSKVPDTCKNQASRRPGVVRFDPLEAPAAFPANSGANTRPRFCPECLPSVRPEIRAIPLPARVCAPLLRRSCRFPPTCRGRNAAGCPVLARRYPPSIVRRRRVLRHLFSLFLGACGMPCGRDPWRSWWRSHKSTRNPRRVAQSLYSCEMSGSSSVKRRRRRRNGATASRATERAAAPAVDFVRTR
jgi:hypothetical protein